jgi:hypothetical protein
MLFPPVTVAADVVASFSDGPRAAGLRSSATAQAKNVTRTRYFAKMPKNRQTPARLPYSNIDSFARSRRSGGTGDIASPHDSRRPIPSWSRFSEPSS